MFLSEEAFWADPKYHGVHPKPGRNFLESFEGKLGFIEDHPEITALLASILGPGYCILNKKIVCGVPRSWMPKWLLAHLKDDAANNLNPYVRPEYRNVAYFFGIDFHQDIIDWKGRTPDFLTLYVYLHPVGMDDAPLYVLPGSHRFGATIFPHSLERKPDERNSWLYGDGRGQVMTCTHRCLVGDAGYVALWHPCLLHGTQPDVADRERISLRYLITKREEADKSFIDEVNETLKGPLRLDTTRIDRNVDASPKIKRNIVNSI